MEGARTGEPAERRRRALGGAATAVAGRCPVAGVRPPRAQALGGPHPLGSRGRPDARAARFRPDQTTSRGAGPPACDGDRVAHAEGTGRRVGAHVSGQLEASERRLRRLKQNPPARWLRSLRSCAASRSCGRSSTRCASLLADLENRARELRTEWLLSAGDESTARRSPTVSPRRRASPAGISSTAFAPRLPATRQGWRSAAILTTRRSRSRNTASIGKRMNAMWTDEPGFNRMPSPLGSSRRPSSPFMRVSAVSARTQRSHTMFPSSRRIATCATRTRYGCGCSGRPSGTTVRPGRAAR